MKRPSFKRGDIASQNLEGRRSFFSSYMQSKKGLEKQESLNAVNDRTGLSANPHNHMGSEHAEVFPTTKLLELGGIADAAEKEREQKMEMFIDSAQTKFSPSKWEIPAEIINSGYKIFRLARGLYNGRDRGGPLDFLNAVAGDDDLDDDPDGGRTRELIGQAEEAIVQANIALADSYDDVEVIDGDGNDGQDPPPSPPPGAGGAVEVEAESEIEEPRPPLAIGPPPPVDNDNDAPANLPSNTYEAVASNSTVGVDPASIIECEKYIDFNANVPVNKTEILRAEITKLRESKSRQRFIDDSLNLSCNYKGCSLFPDIPISFGNGNSSSIQKLHVPQRIKGSKSANETKQVEAVEQEKPVEEMSDVEYTNTYLQRAVADYRKAQAKNAASMQEIVNIETSTALVKDSSKSPKQVKSEVLQRLDNFLAQRGKFAAELYDTLGIQNIPGMDRFKDYMSTDVHQGDFNFVATIKDPTDQMNDLVGVLVQLADKYSKITPEQRRANVDYVTDMSWEISKQKMTIHSFLRRQRAVTEENQKVFKEIFTMFSSLETNLRVKDKNLYNTIFTDDIKDMLDKAQLDINDKAFNKINDPFFMLLPSVHRLIQPDINLIRAAVRTATAKDFARYYLELEKVNTRMTSYSTIFDDAFRKIQLEIYKSNPNMGIPNKFFDNLEGVSMFQSTLNAMYNIIKFLGPANLSLMNEFIDLYKNSKFSRRK